MSVCSELPKLRTVESTVTEDSSGRTGLHCHSVCVLIIPLHILNVLVRNAVALGALDFEELLVTQRAHNPPFFILLHG